MVEVIGRAVVWQAGLPVLRDDPQSPIGDRVDVVGQRKAHDIGLQAVDDGSRLTTGTAMRCFRADGLSGFRFPGCRECRTDVLIKFTRRVIRHVQQLLLGEGRTRCRPAREPRPQVSF